MQPEAGGAQPPPNSHHPTPPNPTPQVVDSNCGVIWTSDTDYSGGAKPGSQVAQLPRQSPPPLPPPRVLVLLQAPSAPATRVVGQQQVQAVQAAPPAVPLPHTSVPPPAGPSAKPPPSFRASLPPPPAPPPPQGTQPPTSPEPPKQRPPSTRPPKAPKAAAKRPRPPPRPPKLRKQLRRPPPALNTSGDGSGSVVVVVPALDCAAAEVQLAPSMLCGGKSTCHLDVQCKCCRGACTRMNQWIWHCE
jgi:hypothetical protein